MREIRTYEEFLSESALTKGSRVKLRHPNDETERAAVYVLLDDPKDHLPTDGLDCRWDNSSFAIKPVFRFKPSELVAA